jgi:hypothetical protein
VIVSNLRCRNDSFPTLQAYRMVWCEGRVLSAAVLWEGSHLGQEKVKEKITSSRGDWATARLKMETNANTNTR